jgi:alginate O-acetyltransferase complex protein AlgI
MRFNSIDFLIFFPIVAIGYFLLPHRFRWLFLLGASYFFYMSWRPKYIVVLLAVTGISYLAGIWLAKDQNPARRRLVLILSLGASLGILLFFKFVDFSNPAFQRVLAQLGIPSFVSEYAILPLGLSFYTLQVMSYIIDAYRGTTQSEKHAGIYALFVSFFPQILAGPIGRADLLLPQYHEKHVPDYERIVSGLLRMVWGLFKKLVIADRLAIVVNTVYGNPTAYTGLPLIVATYAFAFQIYFDFSGYADIAIGAARVLGIRLSENFNHPYAAQSIPEFWRRWHITLSNWLRDYIFYPLHRFIARRQSSRSLLALILPPMVTMLVSGIWHGVGLNFLIWGALHGMFMVLAVLWSQAKRSIRWPFVLPPRVTAGLRIFATFNLVCFTWIFFRANSVADAFYIIGHMFSNLGSRPHLFGLMPGGAYDWMIAFVAILLMEAAQLVQTKQGGLRQVIRLQPIWVRWSLYFGLVLVIFMLGKFEATEFIYSRF